jgi:outer membrane protein assembly factor BamB
MASLTRSTAVLLLSGATAGLALLVACTSDAPADAVAREAGSDASLLGDVAAPVPDAGVPLGDVCGDATGLEKGSPWPLRGGCPKRAGVAGGSGPTTATVKWSLSVRAGDTSPAIAADGAVWVGTAEGDVLVVTPGGAVAGALRTGGAVRSSPARAATGLTLIGSLDGALYGVGSPPPPADAGADGAVDGGADAGPPPVAPLAFRQALGPVASSPAIGGDGTIYVGTTDGKLAAVAGDGSVRWTALTGDTRGSSPAIARDGTIYVGSSDRRLYAFRPDGQALWSFEAGAPIDASPVVGGDETVYVGSRDGVLHALLPDGKERWVYAAGGALTSAAAVRGGVVYVGSDDKKLHAVDTVTGKGRWTYATLGAVATPVVASDGTIFAGSADGRLYALTPSGLLFLSVNVKGLIRSAPALGADGTLYVTTDTALLAIGP